MPKQLPVAMATLECKPRPQFMRFGCDLGLGRLIENWRDLGLEDSGQLEARKWNEWGAGRLAVILGRFSANGRSPERWSAKLGFREKMLWLFA